MASSIFFKVAIVKLLRDVNIGRQKTKAKAKKKQALCVVLHERSEIVEMVAHLRGT